MCGPSRLSRLSCPSPVSRIRSYAHHRSIIRPRLSPYTDEIACVADFKIPLELRFVDLRRQKKMVSPFVLADAEDIGRMRSDLPFLEQLGEELTRPVLP